MKNNRLVIQYYDDLDIIQESFRCTSMDGARSIMSKRVRKNMKSAIYTDQHNFETDMKKIKR